MIQFWGCSGHGQYQARSEKLVQICSLFTQMNNKVLVFSENIKICRSHLHWDKEQWTSGHWVLNVEFFLAFAPRRPGLVRAETLRWGKLGALMSCRMGQAFPCWTPVTSHCLKPIDKSLCQWYSMENWHAVPAKASGAHSSQAHGTKPVPVWVCG